MRYCLQLARLGAGNVAPNPMVGALLVHEGRVIGEGYHRVYGMAHAEVNCLASVKEADRSLIEQSTLYVSLEPCAHQGKTPPCTELILRHRIPRVVVACRDVFHAVDGKGIAQLQSAGVEVTLHILEAEARWLNRRFFHFHQQQRPYVVLKWAQSQDQCIAGPDYKAVAISNAVTNRLVHRWRSEETAIMVGTRTALYDNPRLTNRLWSGPQPLRVLVDRHLKVPPTHHLFSDGLPLLVLNVVKEGQEGNVTYEQLPEQGFHPGGFLQCLYRRGVQSLLVEGGATLLQSFIDEGLWEEVRLITNTRMIIGEGVSAPQLSQQKLLETYSLLDDHIHIYRPSTIQ